MNPFFVRLEEKLDAVSSQSHDTNSQVTNLTKRFGTIETLITGNGEPDRGMVVRLDRVEQILKNVKRSLWMIMSAALTGLAGLATYLF